MSVENLSEFYVAGQARVLEQRVDRPENPTYDVKDGQEPKPDLPPGLTAPVLEGARQRVNPVPALYKESDSEDEESKYVGLEASKFIDIIKK